MSQVFEPPVEDDAEDWLQALCDRLPVPHLPLAYYYFVSVALMGGLKDPCCVWFPFEVIPVVWGEVFRQ